MHAFPTDDRRLSTGRPRLRAVRPGPFATARRVLRTDTDEAARARLDATAVNAAYRAALSTAASVRQVSLDDFLR
jgi:hypothetical protein